MAGGAALSEDATKRQVELAFMDRLTNVAYGVSMRTVRAARPHQCVDPLEEQIARSLELHGSAEFEDASENLDNLPDKPSFGLSRTNR